MNADITSIVFLVILVLVPVGMVTGIVILIVKKIRNRGGLSIVAKRLGWDEDGDTQAAIGTLGALLEPTLFATRPSGSHKINQAAAGTVNGSMCGVAEYHYQGPDNMQQRRIGHTYSLLIVGRKTAGPELMLQHRQKGALAAVAEKMAGGQLTPASVEGWSWALVSSNEHLASLPSVANAGRVLEQATAPGDSIFLFPEIIVWTRQGEITRSWAEGVPEMISVLSRFQ
ncbi:MAG: hypothetical protein KOO61_04230 [Spirochaetales bacterium]|nr:hypothetical protein [Spirochaetales bacterium]